MAASFARQFRAAGWEVVVTTLASTVLELAERTSPDLIVLDVQQGQHSGIDVLRSLKANDLTRKTPVTMISGAQTPETNNAVFAAGAQAFLAKPMGAQGIAGLRALVDAKGQR